MDGERRAWVADVEGVADGFLTRQGQCDAVDDVVDVAPGANLRPVVVHGKRQAAQGAHDEVVNRAFAHLTRAIDVEGSDGNCGQLVLLPVVHGQVLGCELGHGVGPTRFPHSAEGGRVPLGHVVGVAAKNLAGREIDEALDAAGGQRGFKHVHGAEQRHAHGEHRVAEHGVHTCDRGEVNHDIAALHGGLHRSGIEHVALDGADMRVLVEAGWTQSVAPKGVEHDDLVVGGESLYQVRADKAGAAGEKDSPPGNCGTCKRTIAHG